MHYYGKQERPGRKIGHLTMLGATMADVRERAKLVAGGLVTREPGPGREVAVTPTRSGAAAADQVLAARAEPVADLLAPAPSAPTSRACSPRSSRRLPPRRQHRPRLPPLRPGHLHHGRLLTGRRGRAPMALPALTSSLLYGIADFAGVLLSRRASFVTVALAGQAGGFLVLLAVAPGDPTGGDLAWGAVSGIGIGIGTGLAMVFRYPGLSRWRDERGSCRSRRSAGSWPGSAWPSRTSRCPGRPDSGLWPVVAGRLAAVLAILPWYRRSARGAPVSARPWCSSPICSWVSIAVALSRPTRPSPVLLGLTVLRERLTRGRTAGIFGAAVATAVITLGP